MKSSHLIPALVIFLLAGCTNYQIVADPKDENYLSYDHPYTDEALAETLANARKICGQRKQVPIQTSKPRRSCCAKLGVTGSDRTSRHRCSKGAGQPTIG